MKISGNEIRPGSVIEYEGALWAAVKTQTVKPGKGPAYNQVELKNLVDGRKLNNRFGMDERIEAAEILRRDFQFLYREGDMLVFMNTETYDQISLAEDFVGERCRFPAGRHDGDGAAARRNADRHLAPAAGDARDHRGRADDQRSDRRLLLQAGDAGERRAGDGAAFHFRRRADRGRHQRKSPTSVAPSRRPMARSAIL